VRVTVTGATGLIGTALLAALGARGDEVSVLSRDAERSRRLLSGAGLAGHVYEWQPMHERAPLRALAGRDAVVHLAGESIAQRWSASAKARIRESRVQGTRNLVSSLRALDPGAPEGRPRILLGASAIGYYGPHGDEPLDEEGAPGRDFLAELCTAWEREAALAGELGMRVVQMRTGVVFDAHAGALAKMLPPFRLGLGGPVAGGQQYVSWIHRDDLVGIALAAIDDERWAGAVNATAPAPATNAQLASALGAVLDRPALLPVPALALRLLYGEMASLITTGARVMPAKALVLGYRFRYPELEPALRSVLGRDALSRRSAAQRAP
jgi:uncharacterized protein (TIGR01777 family)